MFFFQLEANPQDCITQRHSVAPNTTDKNQIKKQKSKDKDKTKEINNKTKQ